MLSNLNEKSNDRVEKFQKLIGNPEDTALVDFANKISPENQFSIDSKKLGEKLNKDELKENYNVSFTLSDIYAECRKYNLAFIRSVNYKGEYSKSLLSKLKTFIEEKKLAVSENDFTSQLWVLAPAVSDTNEREIKLPCKDPLVFWKTTIKGSEYFILIDGQKNYINPYNLWLGFMNYSEGKCRIAHLITWFISWTLFYNAIAFKYPTFESNWWYLVVLVFTTFSHFISMSIRGSHRSNGEHNESYFNNKKYKING